MRVTALKYRARALNRLVSGRKLLKRCAKLALISQVIVQSLLMSSWDKRSTMSSLSATTRTNDVPFSQARHSVSIGALKTRQLHMAMGQSALTCFVVCGTRYANDFVS